MKIVGEAAWAEIPLGRGMFAKVDLADYAWASTYKWHATKGRTGGWYAARSVWANGKTTHIKMHRELTQAPQGRDVDHVNRDGLDNRRANLRTCCRAENLWNSAPHADSRSPYKGVIYCRGRRKPWYARIFRNGMGRSLGYYLTAEEAAQAYRAAVVAHDGEFAVRMT